MKESSIKFVILIFLIFIIPILVQTPSIAKGNDNSYTSSQYLEPIDVIGLGDFYCLEYSPDGLYLALGASTNVFILSSITFEVKLKLFGHSNKINSLAWSSDGNKLASAARDKSVRIWDIHAGKCLRTLSDHESDVNDVVWSPDGKYIVSGDDYLNIWEVDTGIKIKDPILIRYGVSSLAWAHNKSYLALGTEGGGVEVFHTETWERVEFLGEQKYSIHSIAWSRDDSYILSASHDSTIKVWDSSNWKEITTLDDHKFPVYDIEYSHDNNYFSTCSSISTEVYIWYANNWTVKRNFTIDYRWGPEDVSWNKQDSNLAVLCSRGLNIYDTETWSYIHTIQHEYYSSEDLEWNPDGKRLAVEFISSVVKNNNESNREIHIYATDKWQLLLKFTNASTLSGIAWSPDGTKIAIGYGANTVKIFDSFTWEEIGLLRTKYANISKISWNPQKEHIITVSSYRYLPPGTSFYSTNTEVELWEVGTWKNIETKLNLSNRNYPAWTSDGKRLFLYIKKTDGTSVWNTVEIIDVTNMKIIDSIKFSDFSASHLAISPDDSKLAVSAGNKIHFFDLETGINYYNYTGISCSYKLKLKWSSDGTRVAVGPCSTSIKNNLRIIILDGGNYSFLQNITGHSFEINDFAWNPDNNKMVTTGTDGTIKIFSDEEHITNTKPTVKIQHPENSQNLSGIINITGTASDTKSLKFIEIKIGYDGKWVKTNLTENWTFIWNSGIFFDHDVEIYARASDGYLVSDVDNVSVHITNCDNDKDDISDPLDFDDDNDGYNDTVELEERTDPNSSDSVPKDTDNDLIPDSTDEDIDNDGYLNEDDFYPNDANRWKREDDSGFIPGFDIIVILIALIILGLFYRSKSWNDNK